MNEERQKIESLKQNDPQIIQLREDLKSFCELELFVFIDQIGYIIWKTEHDLAKGKIDYPEWNTQDKYFLQSEIETAVVETCRFGVRPFDVGTTIPTDDYNKWYKWWKDYIEAMSKEQWDKICNLDKRADLLIYRPEGDWRK